MSGLSSSHQVCANCALHNDFTRPVTSISLVSFSSFARTRNSFMCTHITQSAIIAKSILGAYSLAQCNAILESVGKIELILDWAGVGRLEASSYHILHP